MWRSAIAMMLGVGVLMNHAQAAEIPATVPPWVDISTPLLTKLTEEGKKTAWPGQSSGVSVDRKTGAVYVVISGLGLYQSNDKGQTFARCDNGTVGGRCETAFAINQDPNTSRMACFMLDGKCGMSLDGGKTWAAMKDVGRNWDFAAVDWSIEKPQVIFAALHESGGQMMNSNDGGLTWEKFDKDLKYFCVGVVDADTWITSKGKGTLRSVDRGKTWKEVSEFTPISRVMQTFAGKHYMFALPAGKTLERNAKSFGTVLIVSSDKGATWAQQGEMVDGGFGPIFGKDENHILTVGKDRNLYETKDGGKTWKAEIMLPKQMDVSMPGWFTNIAYDPIGDVVYVSKMAFPALKWERTK